MRIVDGHLSEAVAGDIAQVREPGELRITARRVGHFGISERCWLRRVLVWIADEHGDLYAVSGALSEYLVAL